MKAGNLVANLVTANMVAVIATLVSAVVSPSLAEADCESAGCLDPVPCNTKVGACWHPPLETRWQYQLQAARNARGTSCLFPETGGIDVDITAMPVRGSHRVAPQAFDIDFQTDAFCTGGTITQENFNAVKQIHKNGAKAICYVDAGTAEDFRPDFPEYVKFNQKTNGALFGNPVGGFPNEFWLNINNDVHQREFILARISDRLDRCIDVGFDAVEFDNVDAWENDTGLNISKETQLVFNKMLANLAHKKGLTVGLKNDVEQLSELKPFFDFAINEQCFEFDECNDPAPGYPAWPASGKAVFNVEYKPAPLHCRQAAIWDFNSIRKTPDLFAEPWKPCR